MNCLNVLVILLLCGSALCDSGNIESTSFNGRPGCKTQAEVGNIYPNFFDSTRYWRCIANGIDAMPIRCPNGYGYQPSLKTCVSFATWKWETLKMPPSCPDFEIECIPDLQL